jgi:hypothetical protein
MSWCHKDEYECVKIEYRTYTNSIKERVLNKMGNNKSIEYEINSTLAPIEGKVNIEMVQLYREQKDLIETTAILLKSLIKKNEQKNKIYLNGESWFKMEDLTEVIIDNEIKIYVDVENWMKPIELINTLVDYLKTTLQRSKKYNIIIYMYNRWDMNKDDEKYKNFESTIIKTINQMKGTCYTKVYKVNTIYNTKNAVDFNICSDMSSDIEKYEHATYVLCSNDKDFKTIQGIIEHKTEKNIILLSKQLIQEKKIN